jgi:hypothetical protein
MVDTTLSEHGKKLKSLPLETCMIRVKLHPVNSFFNTTIFNGGIDTGYIFDTGKCGMFATCPRSNSHNNFKVASVNGLNSTQYDDVVFSDDAIYAKCRFSLGKLLLNFGITGALLLMIGIALATHN